MLFEGSLFCSYDSSVLLNSIFQEKTNLMAELRRELNISEDEHKALLSRVDADENIRQIRSNIIRQSI